MWLFGRSSAAESKAEAAGIAGILLPLSPRRGRIIRPCFGNTTETPLSCASETKDKEAGTATVTSESSSAMPALSLSWGEGWGEGERRKLQPQAHDDFRNCQALRVPRQNRGFPGLAMRTFVQDCSPSRVRRVVERYLRANRPGVLALQMAQQETSLQRTARTNGSFIINTKI
jgi:hypothetical protein